VCVPTDCGVVEKRHDGGAALVVDVDPGMRQSLRLCLEPAFGRVLGVGSPAAALEAVARAPFDVVLVDRWLGSCSGLALLPELVHHCPVIVMSAESSFESAVEAMRSGAADVLSKPPSPERLRRAVHRAIAERCDDRPTLEPADAGAFMATTSARFRMFLETAERAAAADCVMLLRGESGTGKNMFARWIHERSPRRDRPFTAVNCPSLAGDLMASALFGHKRGSFTGAVADVTGKVHPHEERADVRMLAATNRDLEAQVKAGRFREDMLYRLDVITLALPPLRQRREDALPLAEHFLAEAASRHGRRGMTFTPSAEAAIAVHPWPGNVRELRHAIERGVILAPSSVIEARDLGIASAPARSPPVLGADVPLEEIEREHIACVLARAASFEAAARARRQGERGKRGALVTCAASRPRGRDRAQRANDPSLNRDYLARSKVVLTSGTADLKREKSVPGKRSISSLLRRSGE